MVDRNRQCILVVALTLFVARPILGQTFSGSALSHRSSGSGSGNWTLSENGYVGTYFTLDVPGSVTLAVNASGSTTDAVLPRMNVVIADTKVGFDVENGFNDYEHSVDLPAGTYFIRTEFNNDVPLAVANRQLTVGNLTISGASSVSNTTDTSTNNANALAAADTYIEHFRQGPARVALSGLAPGTPVEVKMVRNAFNFGTMVQGFDADVFLAPVSPGDTTSTAARYQNFVNEYFNILVPSNMGKWAHTEPDEGNLTLENMDAILSYAQAHQMKARMHNLLWGNQQPNFVNSLIASAQSSNPAIAAQAKLDLMDAITDRIAYYVGDGDADTDDGDRSRKYLEIDVLNETLREGTYWDIFGAEGVAEIHKKVLDAVNAAGAETRLYTNEYNIFNYANDPNGGASDPYANWYRRNIEDTNNAGFGEVVTGVGIQYNSEPRTGVSQAHSPARINQVLQNLSVTGLPISITEFSVPPNAGGIATTEQRAALIYDEALRLTYGSPNATSFLIWEPWPTASVNTDSSTIVDNNWNLREAGQALVDLLTAWKTPAQELFIGPDGTIEFSGFFGDYEITIGGRTYDLSLLKGTAAYSLVVAPGDYNGDGTVDAADYTVWRDSLGSNDDLRADGNGNLKIDDGDYEIWKSAFGTVDSLGAGANALTGAKVPEPATGVLFLVGWLAIGRRRPRL